MAKGLYNIYVCGLVPGITQKYFQILHIDEKQRPTGEILPKVKDCSDHKDG